MTQPTRGAKEAMFQTENTKRPNVQSGVMNVRTDEVRGFLLENELFEECHVLPKRVKDDEYRLVVFFVPSAQFSEKKLYSQLKAILPEIAPFCVFVPISSFPLTRTGQIDTDTLNGL
jgi:hypothetical protein